MIRDKKIEVLKYFTPEVTVLMDPYLAEMLIVNLFKNAIRHNVKGGKLVVTVEKNFLRIANSGPRLPVDENLLFKRFFKSSSSPESLGLGLSIVQKICSLYGFEVNYLFADGMHSMTVYFKNEG